MGSIGPTTTTYSDQGDGTIRTTSTYNYSTLCFGTRTSTSVSYIKKCVQGQVFQAGPNDCRGAGNAGNNWGATTFQYCGTQTNACQTASYNGAPVSATLSPAAASCNTDPTAGRRWSLASLYGMPAMNAYNVDFPAGVANLIWADTSTSLTMATSYYLNGSSWSSSQQLKDASLMVLCTGR